MNEQLAEVSNLLIVVSIVVYVLGLIGFSADLAAATQRSSDERLARKEQEGAAMQLASVGAVAGGSGAGAVIAGAASDATGTGAPSGGPLSQPTPPRTVGARGFAYAMTVVAVLLHGSGMVLRGVITGRVPWANMYEFSMSGAAVLVLLFLAISVRRRDLRLLGTFVLLPALVVMLIAQTFWIVPAAETTPSLQNSHWLVIHVVIAILSTGMFALGALIAILQLLQGRHETLLARRAADGGDLHVWGRAGAVLERLPSAKQLEGLSYRIHAIAFVGWTFTLIFGAIWASQAWGRFWNWDPKEVWTFITWVVYACYLHARATRGFRGGKAAWFALAGFLCVIFNYTIVNTVINGLHSYSGL
ncbi:c-type cytochrome biogenesis protein CcsB [Brachybacterium hainanense]|uniref:C-type cytochrome biogenesis protein CcsB n=1 Tax=Brachybacterium hainanense TaxID=1541174 RepID=A0ABV6RFS1_9MICO